MTGESGNSEERRWLIEPPAPGTFRFVFEVGEGLDVTPEVRAALDQLLTVLQGREVEGYSGTQGAPSCPTLWGWPCPTRATTCPEQNLCSPFQVDPCPNLLRLGTIG